MTEEAPIPAEPVKTQAQLEAEKIAEQDAWAEKVICEEDDEECIEKKAKILDDGVEPYVKYLDNMIAEHQDFTSEQKVIDEFKKHADEDG